jgi:hypothetical protein
VSADSVFRVNDAADYASAPFFDVEGDYHARSDLWLVAGVALTLMDLLYGMNQSLKVIAFNPDFAGAMQSYATKINAPLDDMARTQLFKAAMEKHGRAGAGDVRQISSARRPTLPY